MWQPEPPALPAGGPTEEKVREVSECSGIKVPQLWVQTLLCPFPRKESPMSVKAPSPKYISELLSHPCHSWDVLWAVSRDCLQSWVMDWAQGCAMITCIFLYPSLSRLHPAPLSVTPALSPLEWSSGLFAAWIKGHQSS